MDAPSTSRSIGISDLRRAPAFVFEQAIAGALVVLNRSRPVGYILSNKMMARILDQLADSSVACKATARLSTLKKARKIPLDEL